MEKSGLAEMTSSQAVFSQGKMKIMTKIFALTLTLGLALSVFSHQAQAQTATCTSADCPGMSCSNLGTTMMSADHASIIACTLSTGNSTNAVTDCTDGGGCTWKSMTSLNAISVYSSSSGLHNANDLSCSVSCPGLEQAISGGCTALGDGWPSVYMNTATYNAAGNPVGWFCEAHLYEAGDYNTFETNCSVSCQ